MKRAFETRASTVEKHRVFREDILALKSSTSRQEVGCNTNNSETSNFILTPLTWQKTKNANQMWHSDVSWITKEHRYSDTI